MEAALRGGLIRAIPELDNQIYPTNAPEDAVKPYLVYARINTRETKALDGYTGNQTLGFMFSVMARKYRDMKSLAKKVEDFLIALPGTQLDEFRIEDIDINNISEVWEPELKVNRGIIDFTVYF